MTIFADALNRRWRSGSGGGLTAGRSSKKVAFPMPARALLPLVVATLLAAGTAHAALTVTPITWDVVGLDHNRPLTSGPTWFPVGARVCSDSAVSDVVVELVWDDDDEDEHPFINLRPGSRPDLGFDLEADQCVDAYFEIELTRATNAFFQSRPYTIVADAPGVDPASTPEDRQIYIERLVSQNRNSTNQIRYCDPAAGGAGYCDPDTGIGWVVLGAGGSINLAVGNRYSIELTTQTATAYEQLQSFITLSNTIFQVLSVSTTYGTRTAPPERVPVPNPSLWADGCLWDSDPGSNNYNSCLSTGKAGGVVVTLYEIEIISGGGESVGLEALIYDRSGGSFHYNTDYSRSPGEASIISPFAKQFVPSSIAAGGTATLRFTITNPGAAVTGTFRDVLPAGLEVADPANAASTCVGTIDFSVEGDPERHVIEFSGTIGAASTCTITVDVTAAAAGTYDNVSENLFLGGSDTGISAAATLSVTASPPPGLSCTEVPLARWNPFSGSATSPTPSGPTGTTGQAEGGAGLRDYAISGGEWEAKANVADQTLQQARNTDAYFEFRVDTTGYDSIDFELSVYRKNTPAPKKVTLFYGPLGSLVESITIDTPVRNEPPESRNFLAHNLTNHNIDGETVFRLYAYDAGNRNQQIYLVDVEIRGTDFDGCEELEEPPIPPTISKAFNPTTVNAGQASTLTFTISNPIDNDDRILYVSFRDVLPDGMTAVSGTFVNDNVCSSGNWRTDGDDSVLLFTGGILNPGQSCTVSVNVVSTTVGVNVNISDPVDALQTVPGNTAIANLTVNPPPRVPPSIIKFFDPNPLVDPSGSTTLTFRVTNNDPENSIASVAFTDALPFVNGVQMVPVSPFSFTATGCGAGTLSWNSATYTLSFSGGTIAAGANSVCDIVVNVRVPGVDVDEGYVLFPNETSRVSHVVGGTTYYGNASSATLLVDNPIPGISLRKQVGLTDDPEGEEWFQYIEVPPGTDIYYRITVENTGEVDLVDVKVEDPPPTQVCGIWSPLPVADATGDDHIVICVLGPVTAQEGEFDNTAVATGTFGENDYTAESTATYRGVTPTAVVMGRVELTAVDVWGFLGGIGAFEMDWDSLWRLLNAWDPVAAAGLEGASLEELLAALAAYLDPDGDGQVVVFHWETLEERGTAGFHAERLEGGTWVRINEQMLPGLIASALGAEYWLADPGARPGDGYQYRLIEVEVRGTTRVYGPFDLRAGGSGK